MLRSICLTAVVLIAFSVTSPAAIVISTNGVPTVGLPGYVTYTLTASSTAGEQIVGFDFASLPSYGFFGSMHQLNPAGLPTIFQDNNAFFPFFSGYDISQDSQFKFVSSNLIVPSGFASENSHSLRAVFASRTSLGTSVPFVQLAIPNEAAAGVNYTGSVTVSANGTFADVPVSGVEPCFECSPPIITDETIDNVDANSPGFLHHQIAVSAPESFMNLSNLSLQSYTPPSGVSGNGPASPPVLTPGGWINNQYRWYFDWNTVGSPLGTYVWSFHASNFFGMDDGTLTVNITSAVPEPTSPVLIFVALSTAALFRRW